MDRRALLQLIAGSAVAPLSWAQAAEPTSAASAETKASAALANSAAETAPSEWMDQWIQQWRTSGRDVEGLLYLGRFADPVYFLTKEIAWKPNADQKAKLPRITVPVGFVTDFASIPRPFWSLLRPDGNYAYAAVVHDYLYWTQPLSRENCDLIFKFAMQDFSIGSVEVGAIYKAVRAGGKRPWANNANLKKRGEKRLLKTFPTDPRTKWQDYKKRPEVFSA